MSTSDGSFSYNVEALDALATELDADYAEVETQVLDLLDEINRIHDAGLWTGSMYDAFKANVLNYKGSHIDPLLETVKNFTTKVHETVERTRTTTSTVIGNFQ